MSSIIERFNDSVKDGKLVCTSDELDEYLTYGVLFKQGNDYFDRCFKKVVIKNPSNFNIDLSNTIQDSIVLSKDKYCKRIYCMTSDLFNKYKNLGYIIVKNNDFYFRIYNNEEWLVNILDSNGVV